MPVEFIMIIYAVEVTHQKTNLNRIIDTTNTNSNKIEFIFIQCVKIDSCKLILN